MSTLEAPLVTEEQLHPLEHDVINTVSNPNVIAGALLATAFVVFIGARLMKSLFEHQDNSELTPQ
jgi:hypothetical protein